MKSSRKSKIKRQMTCITFAESAATTLFSFSKAAMAALMAVALDMLATLEHTRVCSAQSQVYSWCRCGDSAGRLPAHTRLCTPQPNWQGYGSSSRVACMATRVLL